MITEDYVSFEVAKLLKEKGFDGDCGDCECHMFYHEMTDRIMPITEIGMIPDYDDVYFAPTHQMALKWLREVHKICIVVYPFTHRERGTYTSDICTVTMTMEEGHLRGVWNSYEEAVEESLEYVLENLI